jgi:hypothetical protein
MNKRSLELAADLADIHNTHLGEHYEMVRNELSSSLGSAGLLLTDLREESTQRAVNSQLLKGVAELLPDAKYNPTSYYFEANSPDEVRAIQSSVIYSYGRNAYYIIGKALKKRIFHKTSIIGVSASDGTTTDMSISTRSMKKLEEKQSSLAVKPLSEDEVRHMYSGTSGKLVVNIHRLGMSFPPTPQSYVYSGPTDVEMDQYQVPEHLNRLVGKFGVTDQYIDLLESHAKALPSTEDRPDSIEG